MKLNKFVILALSAVSVTAMADQYQGQSQGQSGYGKQNQSSGKPASQQTVPGAQRLTFEDVKEACSNPARYHNQAAPTNIQISCGDVQYKWVPDTLGGLSLPTSRVLESSIMSDKYVVDATVSPWDMDPQAVSCPRFKQVAELLKTVRAVTCDEIMGFKGTLVDFCADATNAIRLSSQEALIVKETGKTLSFCGGDMTQGKQSGGK